MSFLVKLAAVLAFVGLAVYIFGIPPQLKRKMERAALETMGENKASYVLKSTLSPLSILDKIYNMCLRSLSYI
jgi:hypothetical protein